VNDVPDAHRGTKAARPDAFRRALLRLSLALPAFAAGLARAGAAVRAPWRTLRRVVVSETADGRARVIADGAPTNVLELNGTRITRLWEAPGVPAAIPFAADAGATAGNAYRPGFAGTSFYVAELPPGVGTAQIPLHRNDTLDYMAILAGEVDLVLEDRRVRLRTGDTLVLGGANHSWATVGDVPCVLLFVVVTAQRS